jgi:hypothetical protein
MFNIGVLLMALGKRKAGFQGSMFIYTDELCSSSNAFYETLDWLLQGGI